MKFYECKNHKNKNSASPRSVNSRFPIKAFPKFERNILFFFITFIIEEETLTKIQMAISPFLVGQKYPSRGQKSRSLGQLSDETYWAILQFWREIQKFQNAFLNFLYFKGLKSLYTSKLYILKTIVLARIKWITKM